MTIEQTLLQEMEDSKRWFNLEKDESTYKRDLAKRIELINWDLENMKNPDTQICDLIESGIKETIEKVNKIDDSIEADPLHSEVRILDDYIYSLQQ